MTQQGATETGHRYKPWNWALAAKIIYPQGVEWAISTFEHFKAAGLDGIQPILLQKEMNIILGPHTKIFGASVALRFIPKVIWTNDDFAWTRVD